MTRRIAAFDCETDFGEPRTLYVPFTTTESPVAALVMCRERGILKSKLAAMSPDNANFVYLATLAPSAIEN